MGGRTLGRVALLQVCASSPRRDARLMRGLVAASDGGQRPQRRRASLGLAGRRRWWWSPDERGRGRDTEDRGKRSLVDVGVAAGLPRRCSPPLQPGWSSLVVGVGRSWSSAAATDSRTAAAPQPCAALRLRCIRCAVRHRRARLPLSGRAAVTPCRQRQPPATSKPRALISRRRRSPTKFPCSSITVKNPRKNLAKDVRRWYNDSREEVGQCQHQRNWKRLASVAPK